MIRFALILSIFLPFTSAVSRTGSPINGADQVSLVERHLVEGNHGSLPKAAAAIDWTISESVAPSRFDQRNPSLARFPDGNWLVVWDDSRAGSKKIFGRKYNPAGTPLGNDQLLVGSTVGNNFIRARVAIDTSGVVHLFYRNATTGLIMGTVLDSNLVTVVPGFLINDTTLNSFAGDFDAAIYPNGWAVIAWENYSGLSTTIEMALIDSVGNSVLSPTTANSAGGGFSRFDPTVAIDPSGDFLIGWDDRRNSQPDIFVRLFNGAGTAYGADENILPLPATSFDQTEPRATFSPTGDFAVSWIDSRGGGQVFGKRYNRALGQIGIDIMISDSLATSNNSGGVITSRSDSAYWVTWASSTPAAQILRARLDSVLNSVDTITPADSLPINQKFEPVMFSSDSSLLMGWELVESSNADIVIRLFDSSGAPLMTSEVVVNSDTAGAASVAPAIVAVQEAVTSRALIAFADERNGSFDIWLQELDKDGSKSSGNRLVSQDLSGAHQDEPAIDIASDTALVVWLDSRVVNLIPGLRLYGRYADNFGQPLAGEFLISDSNLASLFGQPSVALNYQTKALTAWVDQRVSTDSLRIYGRWVDQNGVFPGAEFELSTPADSSCTDLNLDSDTAGNFYAVWLDNGKDTAAVTIQWYSSSGTLSGSMPWRPTDDSLSVEKVAAAVSDDGQIALLWVGLGSLRQVYLTVLDTTGSIVVADVVVTSSPLSVPSDPVVSFSETGYLLTGWIDRRDGTRRVYRQLYDDNYSPIDLNTAVSSEPVETMEQPALAAVGGRAWFSWVDPRTDGQNVYANTYVFLSTGVDKEEPLALPNQIELSQNYPNPFNPETRIKFSLSRKSVVSIAVFNLLGRQVRHLVDREYSAGQYEVVWDGRTDGGREVASGLYLYRLKAGEITKSKKMLLLK